MEKILLMVFPFEFHYTYLGCYLETSCGSKHQKNQNNLENFMKSFKLLGFFWNHSSLLLDKHCLGVWPQMDGKASL